MTPYGLKYIFSVQDGAARGGYVYAALGENDAAGTSWSTGAL
jgi:hypothetical protein